MIVLLIGYYGIFFFFFKQKTAYEMRISDWSSDVCSSDLERSSPASPPTAPRERLRRPSPASAAMFRSPPARAGGSSPSATASWRQEQRRSSRTAVSDRSEEHTSELQSLMRISYAVFCLKKKTT